MTVNAVTSGFQKLNGELAAAQAESTASGEFQNVLETIKSQFIDPIRSAETMAMKGIAGQAPAQDVIQNVMQAERALYTGLAIKDRALAAYQEITRMQV
jgi:flagellar hook-basal body complex protein FliE